MQSRLTSSTWTYTDESPSGRCGRVFFRVGLVGVLRWDPLLSLPPCLGRTKHVTCVFVAIYTQDVILSYGMILGVPKGTSTGCDSCNP